MPPVTITDVQTILTQPGRSRLAIVKVQTSEPELYGLGCATFTQRVFAVEAAVQRHLRPLLLGRDVDRIEDLWRLMMVNGYWRNGPVLNNAVSGIDQALWDIKGKRAGLPVHSLLGGRVREAARVYVHADGRDKVEVAERAAALVAEGHRCVRVQLAGYGGPPSDLHRPAGSPDGAYFDPRHYVRTTLDMLAHVRHQLGTEVELLHDIHERLAPIDAVQLAKDVEPIGLFFLEDPLAPEDIGWFPTLRGQTATPLAMGELFNNPHEWRPLLTDHLIDFIRCHVSQLGGLTPARNLAILADTFGVRTAWHGPGDTSPVGHAANLHLDLWAPNFGIQEWYRPSEVEYEVFPGLPRVRDGYLHLDDVAAPGSVDGPLHRPGLGIDIDEAAAAAHPCQEIVEHWTQTRLPDGTPVRP